MRAAGDAAAGLPQTFAACLLSLALGFGAVFHASDGGRAFTTESLRRSQIERQPAELPTLMVVDDSGRVQTLQALLADGGAPWIVDFVYTRCQTVCSALGSAYQQLQRDIVERSAARGVPSQARLLSISFDPEHDRPAQLHGYAQRMGLQPGIWTVVGLQHPQDRRRLLDAFGIMVVPAPLGEFEHNAAFHVIDRGARLTHIVDVAQPGRALDLALGLAAR